MINEFEKQEKQLFLQILTPIIPISIINLLLRLQGLTHLRPEIPRIGYQNRIQ